MAPHPMMNMAEPLKRPRRLRLTSPKSELAPPLERAEQAAVFDWVDRVKWQRPAFRLVHASANGVWIKNKATAALMVRQGLRTGVPDILAPFARAGYIGLAIEMKRKPNVPTDTQEEWLRMLQAHGWRVRVCFTADDAIAILDAYERAPCTIIGPARVVRE